MHFPDLTLNSWMRIENLENDLKYMIFKIRSSSAFNLEFYIVNNRMNLRIGKNLFEFKVNRYK